VEVLLHLGRQRAGQLRRLTRLLATGDRPLDERDCPVLRQLDLDGPAQVPPSPAPWPAETASVSTLMA
jgi:hypothetical protein